MATLREKLEQDVKDYVFRTTGGVRVVDEFYEDIVDEVVDSSDFKNGNYSDYDIRDAFARIIEKCSAVYHYDGSLDEEDDL